MCYKILTYIFLHYRSNKIIFGYLGIVCAIIIFLQAVKIDLGTEFICAIYDLFRKKEEKPQFYSKLEAVYMRDRSKTYDYIVFWHTTVRPTIKSVDDFIILDKFSFPAPWRREKGLGGEPHDLYFMQMKVKPTGVPSFYAGQVDTNFNPAVMHLLYIVPVYNHPSVDYTAWVEFLPIQEGKRLFDDYKAKQSKHYLLQKLRRFKNKSFSQLCDFSIFFVFISIFLYFLSVVLLVQ